MKSIGWLFFLVAIFFAFAAFAVAADEISSSTRTNTDHASERATYQTVTTSGKDSKSLLSLGYGIVSATCFACSALLFIKSTSTKTDTFPQP